MAEPVTPAPDDVDVDPVITETEDVDAPLAAAGTGRARRAALVGLRFITGIVGLAAATATIAAVGLTPFPDVGPTPPSVTITPAPADQVRACAGAVLRLGTEDGQNADVPQAIGVPSVRVGSVAATVDRSPLAKTDAGTGGTSSAPEVLRVTPSDGAAVAGAQSQVTDAIDFFGFAAASCAEPSSSIWLVGGATTVGRTTLITLTNPTAVAATVKLTILGEAGAISAPGMNGIDVPPGTQRVLSLAGFAPGLVSPVVHVEARGGQVVAGLQQSIVRGLDAVGVDLIGAAADPSTELTIPGVRVLDALAVNRAVSLTDWDDVVPVIRIAVPGTDKAKVQVSVIPADPAVDGTSFVTEIDGGTVDELALDSGADIDTGIALADGLYTVKIDSDQPVVAGVRVSTAIDAGDSTDDAPAQAPPSDLAWYAPAPTLTGDTLVTIAPGPDPQLAMVNPTEAEVQVVFAAQGGTDITLVIPAGGSAAAPVVAGTTYLLQGAAGLHAAVSYAGDARLAAYTLSSPRPVSGPITIRP